MPVANVTNVRKCQSPQRQGRTWVHAVGLDTRRGIIAICLNQAAPVGLTVGWFVVN